MPPKKTAALIVAVLASLPTVALPVPGSTEYDYETTKMSIIQLYETAVPVEWGEAVAGVKTRIRTSDKLIAITLDACGSSRGMGFDAKLLDFLEREEVPATLFINARWIEPNRSTLERLAANPLFEIANHGLRHKPASVSGRSAYGIAGTKDLAELIEEIELNNRNLVQLTGKAPRFYRAGTAYYDEVAVKVAGDLGVQVAGYSVLGDAGATWSRQQVRRALLGARPGDIVLAHMNRPDSGTALGIMDAIPQLKKQGYRFVRLSDVELE